MKAKDFFKQLFGAGGSAPKKSPSKGKSTSSKGNGSKVSSSGRKPPSKPPKAVKKKKAPLKGTQSRASSKGKNLNKEQIQKAKKYSPQSKVPLGRTLTAKDEHLMGQKGTGSKEKHPLVVVEKNKKNDLAVVQLTTKPGKNKTRLKNYQQGQSFFKHFIEVEDDEGNPIRINEKFKENHSNMDVSAADVEKIKKKVLYHTQPSSENRKKMKQFLEK